MPSGRKRSRPEPEPPVFFLDRSIGRHLVADALRSGGFTALPMADVYPDGADQSVPDDEWIGRAGQEGWVAVTKDTAITRVHSDALEAAQLRVFAFNNANISGSEMVERLNEHLNRIVMRAAKPGPYVYVIGRLRLELAWPKEKPDP